MNQDEEEKQEPWKLVAGIVFVSVLIVLIKMAEKNDGLKLNEFFNNLLFETSEAEENSAVAIHSTQNLFYPKDADEAVALYNKYSLQRAASPRDLSYQELANDSLKVKYLVTKGAIKEYEKYLGYESHKAFAVSGAGNYGYSGSDRVDMKFAIEEALTYCKKYMKNYGAKQCHIIDINGIFLGADKHN